MTALATVFIGGTEFTANSVLFTFYNFSASPTPIFLTYDFPQVTLTSLTPGEVITWTETLTGTDVADDGQALFTYLSNFLFLISSITVPPDAATPVTVLAFRFTADQRFRLKRTR
jgi:hypothetical protein